MALGKPRGKTKTLTKYNNSALARTSTYGRYSFVMGSVARPFTLHISTCLKFLELLFSPHAHDVDGCSGKPAAVAMTGENTEEKGIVRPARIHRNTVPRKIRTSAKTRRHRRIYLK